jgi:predicted P-loop ATPase
MLGRDDLIAAARKLWGEPTQKHANEWRFGTHQSKSITFEPSPVWHDHEANHGGGVWELCQLAGLAGNGHDTVTSAWVTYDYRDERGALLFQVVRKPGHKFFQREPDGTPGIKGVRRVIYRLPQLLGSDGLEPVFICEGEKDADNLARLGFVTTTNPGGAGKWREEYSVFLSDRDCIILPDNDQPGIEHAAVVERLLHGHAHSVKILRLPGLGDKEDVSDWIARGGTADMLRQLVTATPVREWATGAGEPVDAGWIHQCATNKSGEPLPTLENALIALRNDAKLKGLFSFDEMLRAPMINRSEPVPVEDDDITDAQEYMQVSGLKRLSREVARQAIIAFCGDHPYHPVRKYLDVLEWDGIKRLDTWLHKYLGAKDDDYNSLIGQMFLVSMVARIYKPGCKVDYMLVLEGPQGERKSTACRVLFSDEYFSDNLPDITAGKDVSVHLRGKWGIEIAELHAFNRAESTHLKSFVSRQVERYRPPYGHMEVDEKRQCVFIGTTNKDTYLKDETGGRRFWPVVTGEINIEKLTTDRDHLIAEAVHEYRQDAQWWPSREFEEKHIKPQQAERYDQDAWYEKVLANLGPKGKTSTAEIANGLGIETSRLDRGHQLRIAAIMRELKWKQKHTRKGNIWVSPSFQGEIDV